MRRKVSPLAAIDTGDSLGTDRGPKRLRKRYERFARASLRQVNDSLSRGHHLARFTKRRDHRPIGVGDKGGVGRLVFRDLRVYFRCVKLRLSRVALIDYKAPDPTGVPASLGSRQDWRHGVR